MLWYFYRYMTHDMAVSEVNTTSQIKEPAERKISPSREETELFGGGTGNFF